MYLQLLKEIFDPALSDLVNNNRYLEDHLILQQGGAPAHFAALFASTSMKYFLVSQFIFLMSLFVGHLRNKIYPT